jgi:hypothetical protein
MGNRFWLSIFSLALVVELLTYFGVVTKSLTYFRHEFSFYRIIFVLVAMAYFGWKMSEENKLK